MMESIGFSPSGAGWICCGKKAGEAPRLSRGEEKEDVDGEGDRDIDGYVALGEVVDSMGLSALVTAMKLEVLSALPVAVSEWMLPLFCSSVPLKCTGFTVAFLGIKSRRFIPTTCVT